MTNNKSSELKSHTVLGNLRKGGCWGTFQACWGTFRIQRSIHSRKFRLHHVSSFLMTLRKSADDTICDLLSCLERLAHVWFLTIPGVLILPLSHYKIGFLCRLHLRKQFLEKS